MATRQIDLFEKHRGTIRAAFINAVFATRNSVHIKNLEEFIRAGRVEGAIKTLNLDERLIKDVVDEVSLAYGVQGKNLAKSLKPPKDIERARWEKLRNPITRQVAEQFARDESSKLIVEIINPQRELARSIIEQGVINRVNPLQVARQLVGHWNQRTRRREGGFIGLTTNQSIWVDNVQRELSSGFRADLENYLTRKLRDKRFDRTVRRAISEGTPIPKEKIDNMVSQYKARALKYRGNAIGRTESLRAMSFGRRHAMEGLVQNGAVKSADNMKRKWISRTDSLTRDTHRDVYGQTRGLYEAFDVGGYSAMQPGDDSLPAKEVVNCRCYVRELVNWKAERELGV